DIYDAAPLQEDFSRSREALSRVELAVVSELTASNRAPKDAYAGPNRAELESSVRVTWAQRSLNSDVLAVRVHEPNWRRFTGVRWRPEVNGWESFDQERLSATVVVRKDNRRATLHDVSLSRDPDTGRLDIEEDPVVRPRDMLLANL
ncbi:MAG: hypothetical protein VX938_00610, partial [Myxococcota bacterium]|nr:hypothetical protein [Myxococcota bacterium]